MEFFSEFSTTWKVLGNEFGSRKYWKLKLNVLKSPGIYMRFKDLESSRKSVWFQNVLEIKSLCPGNRRLCVRMHIGSTTGPLPIGFNARWPQENNLNV